MRRVFVLLAMTLAFAASVRAGDEAPVRLVEKGVRFSLDGVGPLTLGWPSLRDDKNKALGKIETATVDGEAATLAYTNGAEIAVRLLDGGELRYAVRKTAPGFTKIRFDLSLPAAFRAQGGHYRVDKADFKAVPEETPAKAQLYQGHGVDYVFRAGAEADAPRFALNVPAHGWNEFVDHRAWNDNRYNWWGQYAYNPHHADLILKLRFGDDADTPAAATKPSGGATAPAASKAPSATTATKGTLSLGGDGIRMTVPSVGALTIKWPKLQGTNAKFVAAERDGDTATLRYTGDAVATVKLDGQKGFDLSLKNAPAGFKGYRLEMLIPLALNDGGSFSIDGGASTPFPAAKPAKPFLYQGHARKIAVAGGAGGDFALELPPHGYMQLQDNREWNWNTFFWNHTTVHSPANTALRVNVNLASAGGRAIAKLVDRYGQDYTAEFAEKVKTDEALKRDAETEAAFYADLAQRYPATAPVDRFGSPVAGEIPPLRKTGFFHVQRLDNGRWTLVNPEGHPFFQLGVCAFNLGDTYTYIAGREAVYDELPPRDGDFASAWHPQAYWKPNAPSFYAANWVRKYGKPFDIEEFRAAMVPRVRAMGFNAFGAFSSGVTPAFREAGFPGTLELPMPREAKDQLPGARGYVDPFDPAIWARIDGAFERRMTTAKDDPLVIGWYIGNEPHAENVARAVAALPAKRPAKQAFVAFLRERHGDDVAAFAKAWGIKDAADWDAVAEKPLGANTRAASADLDAFATHFFETYYGTVENLFRKHNPNHLLIGHRWMPSTANNPLLVRAAAKYNDVLSVNYYAYAFDMRLLGRLREWAGDKPFIFSEWHFASQADAGLVGGARIVHGQTERANGYRHYVEQAAALPYVVGCEWFTLLDQARTGRHFQLLHGEKANTGLFTVADRPWKELAEAAAQTNRRVYDVMFGKTAPFVFDDPRFTNVGAARKTLSVPRAERPIPLDGSREAWPGFPPENVDKLAAGPNAGGVSAAFRACWDDTALHLMVEITDPTPMRSEKKGADLWNADAVEVFFGSLDLDAAGGLRFGDRQILAGAKNHDGAPRTHVRGAPPEADTTVRAMVFPRGDGYVLQMALPYAALGIATPKGGEEFLFDLAVDDSGESEVRQRQFLWNGGSMASSDRSLWGRGVFVQ